MRIIKALLVITLVFAGIHSLYSQDKPHSTDELSASVPVLSEFHEVIYPLWHDAWPNKDVALVKELLPKVESYTVETEKAELPGILRDKQEKWNEGVKILRESTDRLKKAVAAGADAPIMDAVEALHANYEKLVRLIRPLMKELDAFHQVLYKVYHYYMPGKDFENLCPSATEMVKKCQELDAAPLPRKVKAKEAEFKAAVKKLTASCLVLVGTCENGKMESIETAVETVHTDYQSIEKMFD